MFEAKNIYYSIGQRVLLQDVSLHMEPGSMLCMLGDNGAGKSTLMRIMAGLTKPDKGEVLLHGKNVLSATAEEMARLRSFMLQLNPPDIQFTVTETLEMARFPWKEKRPGKQVTEWIHTLIYRNDLFQMRNRSLALLSGGEQQRTHFARCILQRSETSGYVLFLDEPLNNLDIRYQHILMQQVKEFCAEGNSAILVLHDLNVASEYCSQFVLLQKGKVYAAGTRAEVMRADILSEIYQFPVGVVQLENREAPFIIPGYKVSGEKLFCSHNSQKQINYEYSN